MYEYTFLRILYSDIVYEDTFLQILYSDIVYKHTFLLILHLCIVYEYTCERILYSVTVSMSFFLWMDYLYTLCMQSFYQKE